MSEFYDMRGSSETAFDPLKFNLLCGWLTYEGRFVVRFKHQPRSAPSFRSFLAGNFTVEEFFGRLDGGELPLRILESKGYIQPRERKLLRKKARICITSSCRHQLVLPI
jgi:hypothetical protein